MGKLPQTLLLRVPLLALVGLPFFWAATTAFGEALTLRAETFGVKADGVSDDGPAIQRMLATALRAKEPVRLQFPEHRTIRVESAPQRYVFWIHGAKDLTLDGGGSTFLLGPSVRFLHLTQSRNITVTRLNIDFAPLPFADGTVTAVHAGERRLDVRLAPWVRQRPLGGPTREDGEQAFFAMLWYPGPYGLCSQHYWITRMEPGPASDMVRAYTDKRFQTFSDIVPGTWRISLPVPGIAHRYGPGACLEIEDNDTVTVSDVELWSAPWFGFFVARNRGAVTFRRVNIRPKPGSGRLTSTWRDGFHVKGNSAKLLWDDCIVSGMNDDAFNISTHCSRVRKVLSPTEIEVLQIFPLTPMPWYPGDTFAAADSATRTFLGKARIVKVIGWTTQRRIDGKPAASPVTIEIDKPIAGLQPGSVVWQPETSNPNTTLRHCIIQQSCRMQSPVTLEGCQVTALLWFYGDHVEGPFPRHVVVRDCTLRRGRGNPHLAVVFDGRKPGATGPSVIHDVDLERNRIWGDFSAVGIDTLRMVDNQFCEKGAAVHVAGCKKVEASGNRDGQGKLVNVGNH